MKQAYDVIVVGAGSAGSPLAARLSEDKRRSVLLLEAGSRFFGAEQFPPELRFGGLLSAMMPGHRSNWGFVATLREGIYQPNPRGRVLGGSSAVNGTLFTRGLPEDFDGWAREGNPEWSYDRVLPFFKKLETDHDVPGDFHGTSGPVPVRRAGDGELVPIDHAFRSACRAAGFPDDPDMNGPQSIGVGRLPVNTLGGIRVNTAIAYLGPAIDRPNLTVRGDTLVTKIVFDGHSAMGVEIMVDGVASTIQAGEIVLSAGAIKSPHLLMLSGIGPVDELRRFAIPVRQELPLVGRRFTDHCSLAVPFRMPKRSSPNPDPKRSAWAHIGLHYTSNNSDQHSDMMLIQSAIPTNSSIFHGLSLPSRLNQLRATLGTISLGKLIDHARYGWSHAISCIMQRDGSRGELHLTSASPTASPELVYHYLESEADLRRMRDALRLAARLIASEPYRVLGASRLAPSDDELGTDAALDAYLLQHQGTSMHMASTCRMGPSPETGVVDQYCRVHGVDRLRVVDSSIMPTVVRRCPAATAIMIGERAAAFFD